MKFAYALIPLAVFASHASAFAQGQIWRCANNSYTNDAAQAKAQGCKQVEGGNVTVVTGTRVNGAAASSSGGTGAPMAGNTAVGGGKPAPAPRVEANEQKARDSEARSILDAELKKAEARLAELQKDYNGGQPEMLGPEHRNHQKYLERTAELKASIDRTENDIAGLKRELARSGNAAGTASK